MYWGLVLLGFKRENIDFYAPDRFTEGYGMNTEAVEMLCDKYDLIISVDCGINSTLEAEVCRKKGVDLIITDHHHLTNEIPNALAVINPRLSEIYNSNNPKYELKKNYLSPSVTGVGVAWFVVVWLAYYMKQDLDFEQSFDLKDLNQLLSFVAIGTIADCQSILDETNRLLVKSGLKIIQHLSKQTHTNEILRGLWLLLDQSGLRNQVANGYNLVSSDLGFTLSPILNSSGRLSHASHSIQTLLAGTIEDKEQASDLVSGLIATNNQRKQEVSRILSEVENDARIQFELGKNIIWVSSSDWSKGLIGLLASRLVNQFGLPVVVVELPELADQLPESSNQIVKDSEADPKNLKIRNPEALCTASLRAPEGYSLPLAMNVSPELFEKFGGHPGAAGFSAKLKNLDKIEELLNLELGKQIENIDVLSKTDYSHGTISKYPNNQKLNVLSTKINSLWVENDTLADQNFWSDLLLMEPFGQDFLYPLLIFPFKIGSYTTMSENKHLKFDFKASLESDSSLSLVWFNYAKNGIDLSALSEGTEVFVVGRPQQNAWKNKLNWQIIVEDLIVV
jgi:single-stranded-DNA-specific exonuclease